MADLKKWKPWYARIPGATVATIGTVLCAVGIFLAAPFFLGLWLMNLGGDMMQRKPQDAGSCYCWACGRDSMGRAR